MPKSRLRHEAIKTDLEGGSLAGEDFREVELDWLQENLSILSTRHPGEWIAIDGPRLVAHASDLPTLLQLSRECGHPDPFITAIPAGPIVHLNL